MAMNKLYVTMKTTKTHRKQEGASIIEVLVAALILSVGMLALVGVQATSTQLGQLSQFRAEASRLGQSYADRIRANQGVNQTNVAGYVIAGAFSGDNRSALTVQPNCAATCTDPQIAAQIAAIDVNQMRNQARLALPNGDFRVQVQNVAGVGNVVDIWVLWVQATTATENTTTNTVGGIGCPSTFVSGNAAQCQLTRIVL